MAVTVDAARNGMQFFDSSWKVGLWTFSTKLSGSRDYRELVPIGPLAANRDSILRALDEIEPKPRGDTGLYDTIVDGYTAVQAGWDPSRVNSLVVLTDGRNDDPQGRTLDQTVNELRAHADPAKPIQVILIGIGPDVAMSEMAQITRATGGGAFVVRDPAQVQAVFLQAIALRGQVR